MASNGYTKETHRMYISRHFSELKSKIKKTFKINFDIECIYYNSDNSNGKFFGKICVRTEEDYEIMLLSLINHGIINISFYDKN